MFLQKNKPISEENNSLKGFIVCKLYQLKNEITSVSFVVSNSLRNNKKEEHNVKFNKIGNTMEFLSNYNNDCMLLKEDTVIGLGGKEYHKMQALSIITKFIIKTKDKVMAYQLETNCIGVPTGRWEDASSECL